MPLTLYMKVLIWMKLTQNCPENGTVVKFLRIHGRYDMIDKGFLLGVKDMEGNEIPYTITANG